MVDKLINFLDLAFGCQYRIHLPRNDDPTSKVEGFHVTSYQTNFASHHIYDRHVGFLFTRSCIGRKPTKWQVTFDLVHTTIPNYN